MNSLSNIQQTIRDPRFQKTFASILISILFVFHVLFIAANLKTTFDDSYMFLRYAENILNGHGIAWNPDGVQTYGTTSILYLLFIVIERGLFRQVDGSVILVITSALFGVSSLILISIGCLRWAVSDFFKRSWLWIPFFVAILFLPSPTFLFHTASGMDTTLSIFCNSLLIFGTMNWGYRKNTSSLALAVLTAYLSFLARPDNIFYAVLFPMLYSFFFIPNDRLKKILVFTIGLIVLIALDTGIKYSIFGDPLPLPFYAKSFGYADGYSGLFRWNPITYLFYFFRFVFPFVLLIILFVSRKNPPLFATFFIPVLVTFFYYFSVVQIMGFGARYYFPSIPFFVIGSFLIVDSQLADSSNKLLWKQPIRLSLAGLGLLFFFIPPMENSLAQIYEKQVMRTSQVYESRLNEEVTQRLPELGWWESIQSMAEICSQLPVGTKIAMSEYGLVGAQAPQIIIIDLLGLHDPFFAHHGFSADELFRRQPDLIWLPYPDYTKTLTAIQDHPLFLQEYDYYPHAFDYGIATRRDSENYFAVHQIIEKIWKIEYPNIKMEESLFHQP